MLNAATQAKLEDGTLTPATAIRAAWGIWLVLMIIPFIEFLYIVWKFSNDPPAPRHDDGETWFIVACAYLLAVVPVSFFWRSRLFQSYWMGHPVRPSKYLFGTISVWAALVIGGLFSLTGCLRYDTLLPNLLPALVAFMFCVTLWPSGRAMTKRVGNAEDPEVYEEPS